MSGDSTNRVESPLAFKGEKEYGTTHQGLFSELSQLDALHRAYSQINEARALDSNVDAYNPSFAVENVNGFLEQLAKDLRAGTFLAPSTSPQPDTDNASVDEARADLRTQIVQLALAHVLESVFPADPPVNAVGWTADVIGRGLSRVYAIAIEEKADLSEHVLAAVRLRVDDAAFLALLGNVLQELDFRVGASSNPLASVLTRIGFHNLDRVLHQANLLGRQGSYVHATCVRFDHVVALFLDNDTQYDWLLSAVQKRLREALAEIKAEVDPEKTQLVDLARGEKLVFLDHEFRLTKERDGTACVEHKRLVKRAEPKPEPRKPSRRSWRLPLPAWPRRKRPKPTAPEEAPAGRRWHWPSLNLHWPRSSWSLNLPRRVYVVAGGIIILAAIVAGAAGVMALLRSREPQLYPVRGQVFYEGQPAAGALVVFLPQDPNTPQTHVASALVANDGTFVLGTHKALDGALAGPYVVTVWRRRGTTAPLPPRYASRRTTPLKATVQIGPTDVPVIELQAQSP